MLNTFILKPIPLYAAGVLFFSSLFVGKYSKIRFGLINPLSLFFFIWLLNLCFYQIDTYFNYFDIKMSGLANACLLVSFGAFFIAGSIPLFLEIKEPLMPENSIDPRRLWIVNSILLVLFITAIAWKYMLLLDNYGGLFCALKNIRADQSQGIFHKPPFFLHLFTLPAYLLIINLGILAAVSKSRLALLLGILVVFLAFINSSMSAMRGQFFNFSLFFFMAIIVVKTILNEKTKIIDFILFGLAGLVILAMLALSSYLRSIDSTCQPKSALAASPMLSHLLGGGSVPKNQAAYSPVQAQSLIPASASVFSSSHIAQEASDTLKQRMLVDTFVYVAGPLPAYSYFLEHPWPSYYFGTWTFAGLYVVANRLSMQVIGKSFFPGVEDLKTFYAPITVGPFNTTNYLTYVYSDFSFPGMIAIPFAMGFFSMYFFIKALRNKRFIDIQIVVLIFTALILSVRGILTNGVFFWVLICLMPLQWFYIKKKNQNESL